MERSIIDMSNLGNILKSMDFVFDPVIPVTSFGLGLVFMGAGVYSSITEKQTNDALFLMGIGATMISFGGGFLLGRKYEKLSNKNTYQTKP